MAEDLRAPFEMPEGWVEIFLRKGPGDPTLPDEESSKYPNKNELLLELLRQHERVKSILCKMDENQFNEKLIWRFANFMPTIGDVVAFMCINHEAMHLGQLAAWRRAMDLPSALGSMEHVKRPYI